MRGLHVASGGVVHGACTRQEAAVKVEPSGTLRLLGEGAVEGAVADDTTASGAAHHGVGWGIGHRLIRGGKSECFALAFSKKMAGPGGLAGVIGDAFFQSGTAGLVVGSAEGASGALAVQLIKLRLCLLTELLGGAGKARGGG